MGGAHHFCQLFSIDKNSGHIKKYLTFQYRQPRIITHTKEGIFYAHAFNFQQLRVEKDFLLFSISAISKCDELNIEDDTISTAIVKIDTSSLNRKIVNITYRPNQLINLYDLTLNDLEHKDIINQKSLFLGFDYLSWQAGPVYLNKDYTFIEKRQTWGNSILFFK